MNPQKARAEKGPSGSDKLALLDLTYPQIQELLLGLSEPGYRADQLYEWTYSSLASDFAEMHSLPRHLRDHLEQTATISGLTPLQETISPSELTRKVLFGLSDDETVESVLMLYDNRKTVCLSTQVGCPLGCPFCATGQSGFIRDLTPGEIIEQVLYFARELREQGEEVTNVVFMGMGEPLLNYDAVWQAIETLTDPRGYNLGARRITLSTVGIVPAIERLSRERLRVGLAVSLHAADDHLRKTLVPVAQRYPLHELLAACRTYVKRTRRRVTFEYALIQGVNDSPQHAFELAGLLKGLLCHVNLIPLNPTAESPWQASSEGRAQRFHEELTRLGINSTIRLGRGVKIEAGCGQLRSRWHSTGEASNCLFGRMDVS